MTVGVETVQLDAFHSTKFAGLLATVAGSPGGVFPSESHHKLQGIAGVALLIDPVNGNPAVFVAPGSLSKFTYEGASGTDKMRARIQAQQFFDRVVSEAQRAMPACLNELSANQRNAVQDALANWDSSSDEEIAHAWSELGLSEQQCQAALAYRDRFLTQPMFQLWPVSEGAGAATASRPERQR